MATVLSHQQLQQHQHHQLHHHQAQLLYPIHQLQHLNQNNSDNLSPQQGSILENLPQHHHHQQSQNHHIHHQQLPQQQVRSADFFCKDCSVMFESSTSLEVHLSYHKENLLSRWANQESLDNKSSPLITIASTSSPSPRSDQRDGSRDANNTNTSNTSDSSTSSQQYFNPIMEPHGQYLPPQYNNNTGDHHMEPTYRPNSGASDSGNPNFGQPPVDNGNGIPYENNFHPAYHPQNELGLNHPLFSPNGNGNIPPPNNSNSEHQVPGGGGRGEQSGRESAEILDLDSHKVHIYQHQQQQQQQQQLGLDRSFFHRPYLPHLQLPPPPQQQQQLPPPANGWPSDLHGFGGRFALSPAGYPVEHPPPGAFYAPPMPPTTSAGNGVSPTSYEIVRIENPNAVGGYGSQHSPMNYPPQPPPPVTVSSVLQSHLQSNGLSQGFVQQQIHSPYPIVQPPQAVIIKSDNSSSSLSPGALPMTKGQRSPVERGGRGPPAAGVKTKGWKGGECKRPKTYNCPACNKWFTSSGHLKRHYGTTLHKNSIKQLGESPEDTIKPTMTKGKKALAKAQAEKASRNSSPKMEDSSSNGKLTPVFIPPPMELLNGGPNGELKPTPNFSLNPPVPISSPSAFAPTNHNNGPGPLGYNPYAPQQNSFIPNQNINHQQQHHNNIIPQQHHSPQVAYTNGYSLDLVPNGPMYTSGNGYRLPANNNGDSSVPLPPFSSVGQSHYEGGPPILQLNLNVQQQPNGNNGVNGNMDNAFPPNHQNPNRVTPPYHHPSIPQQQQQPQHPQMNSTPSPHNSVTGMMSNSGQHDTSFESERDIPNGSPSEPRSDSGSGSMEGSLDGMDQSESDGAGSPTSSNSDFQKDAEGGERTGEVLKCPDCSKTFGRACYLTQHSNSHRLDKLGCSYKCPQCGKKFPEAPALSDHIDKHNVSNKPYQCDLCPKSFNHKTDLRRHNCLHTGEKPFTCTVCSKGFIRKDHMTKHYETHRKKTHNNNGSSN